MVGSAEVTRQRFTAFAYGNPVVDVPFETGKLVALEADGDALCIRFDPAAFHDDWSGQIEVLHRTNRAQDELDRLAEVEATDPGSRG